ncbi:uncharacterized protein IL334_001734 [Kwoniella shivajii]|uniref:F-box domain-containing protein n=1 Tax=Kwoniella shivajii TaxID=564305 RepID=A0ABZ1CT38_9TREE|nr:hypothetical protein IL334_001734 [Kwoniella shivajii]
MPVSLPVWPRFAVSYVPLSSSHPVTSYILHQTDLRLSHSSAFMPKKAQARLNPLPLPTEMLDLIFSILLDTDRKGLAKCCLVSQSMNHIAASILYRRIRVSPIAHLDSRADHATDRFTATGKQKTNTRKKKLLKCAEIVTIDYHHASWCGNKTFKYPKLDTLVLRMNVNGLGPVLHAHDILEKQCTLVKCLEPRKVVFYESCFTNISGDMLGVPFKLLSSVEAITFVCTLTGVKPTMSWGGYPNDMSRLKKLVWIFHTPNPSTRWVPGAVSVLGRTRSHLSQDIMVLTGTIRNLPDIPILIVNAGSLDHVYVGENLWDETRGQEKFASVLKQNIIRGGYRRGVRPDPSGKWVTDQDPVNIQKELDEEAMSSKIFERITFLSMKDYLMNHNWVGELRNDEARAWLQ